MCTDVPVGAVYRYSTGSCSGLVRPLLERVRGRTAWRCVTTHAGDRAGTQPGPLKMSSDNCDRACLYELRMGDNGNGRVVEWSDRPESSGRAIALAEATALTQRSGQTLRRAARSGALRGFRPGGCGSVVFLERDLWAFFANLYGSGETAGAGSSGSRDADADRTAEGGVLDAPARGRARSVGRPSRG